MSIWRIKCHSCGNRSAHSTSSGVRQFQCSTCEAWNFLDNQGNYVDPPIRHVQQQHSPRHTTKPYSSPRQQQDHVFCSVCVQNQQIYRESLANYLPDESHPQYRKYEEELPAYKRKLEERYPQICKRCAPKAQSIIHQADYKSMTANAERLLDNSRGSRRSASPALLQSRDDGWKKAMRALLDLAGWLEVLSALYQALWHAHSILGLHLHSNIDEHAQVSLPKASQCIEEASRSVYSYACSRQIGSQVPKALLISACLLWYNHGLRYLYNSHTRYSSIDGKTQHFVISAIVLVIRATSFCVLFGPSLLSLSRSQQLALHGFVVALVLLGRVLARSNISANRWRVEGSIMPRPEERDILGRLAGPSRETHTPYASPTAPSVLLREQQSRRFPLDKLLPGRRVGLVGEDLPPSPPGSDYGDPMDIETSPLVTPNFSHSHSATRFSPAQSGWDGMRTNILSMDDELRARQERQRAPTDRVSWMQSSTSVNPFRGQLPPAPRSQEQRLRNPVSQVPQFKDTPITQRQDFLKQMRDGIDKGRGIRTTRAMSADTEASDVTTDARSRTRGQLELNYSSGWHLPSDTASATGLEDLFGGSFQIEDPGDANSTTGHTSGDHKQVNPLLTVLGALAALSIALLSGVILDVAGMRRTVCLALVHMLEALGY